MANAQNEMFRPIVAARPVSADEMNVIVGMYNLDRIRHFKNAHPLKCSLLPTSTDTKRYAHQLSQSL